MKTSKCLIFLLSILLIGCNEKEENEVVIQNFTDERDGTIYTYVDIGEQTWMAENVKYQIDTGSWHYSNSEEIPVDLGLLYDWETAKSIAPKTVTFLHCYEESHSL